MKRKRKVTEVHVHVTLKWVFRYQKPVLNCCIAGVYFTIHFILWSWRTLYRLAFKNAKHNLFSQLNSACLHMNRFFLTQWSGLFVCIFLQQLSPKRLVKVWTQCLYKVVECFYFPDFPLLNQLKPSQVGGTQMGHWLLKDFYSRRSTPEIITVWKILWQFSQALTLSLHIIGYVSCSLVADLQGSLSGFTVI